MSSISVRTGNVGTANVDTVTLPDGSSAVGHAVLGADGNPILPVQDASMQALVAAIAASVTASQAFVLGRSLITLVDTFGATVVTSAGVSSNSSSDTDAFGNPLS